MKKNRIHINGFTLVEMLVAVSIVLVGVTAAFSAAQIGLSATSAVRDQVTGMFLAQEGLEGVLNIKDSNLLKNSYNVPGSPVHWLEGITALNGVAGAGPCGGGNTCGYDILGGPSNDEFKGGLIRCSSTNAYCEIQDYLHIADDQFFRQMNDPISGSGTGYVREITVQDISPVSTPDSEARVRVVVTRPGHNFKFEAYTNIYNWF